MTSAVRVGGERLYTKAHRGEAVETPEREVDGLPGRAARGRRGDAPTSRSSARAGTYIRTLIETLDDAYCAELRRTAIGPVLAVEERRPRSSPSEQVAELVPAAAEALEEPVARGYLPHGAHRSGRSSIQVTSLPDAEPRPRKVAIGTFDGVHLGHQAVIDGADTVLTFDPHPLEVLHPAALPKLIMPFEVKRDVIEGLGVRRAGRDPLRRGVRQRSAEEFIEEVLIEQARRRAGLGRRELPLRRQGQGRPGDARRARRVRDPGRAAGRGRRRDRLLDPDPGAGRGRGHGGRPALPRRSVHGRGRGRRAATSAAASSASRPPTSCPTTASRSPATASTRPSPTACPAAVNVGVRPTFETGRGVLIETYLIDHEEDLYGSVLRVAFVERLRGEKRFAGVEELIAQMRSTSRTRSGSVLASSGREPRRSTALFMR